MRLREGLASPLRRRLAVIQGGSMECNRLLRR